MWFSFIIISVACLGVSGIIPFLSGAAKKGKKILFYSLFAGVFFAGLFAFLPMHLAAAVEGEAGIAQAVFLSVYNAMQIFTIGTEYEVITAGLEGCEGIMHTVYSVWFAVLFVLAPIFTFSFVVSLFKNITEKGKYFFSYYREAYVFSTLNEKSLALARDIKNNSPESAVVFTDVFEENEEKTYELAEKARKIGAICFRQDLLSIDFMKHSKNKEISFFMISDDEAENLNQAIETVEKYRKRKNTSLYVFSTNIESELLLTAVDKGEIKVRRINPVRSLINRVLYEKGEIFFKNATEAEDGVKDISAVVVGMGRHGTEMIKALTWFCQMDGYRVEINGFDKDEKAKERFRAIAPDLLDEKYNKKLVEGESAYSIDIHSQTDAGTSDFDDEIKKLTKASYALVALGDDSRNIETAVHLRMLFERMGIHPVIQAIVYNSHLGRMLSDIENSSGQPYDIDFIGGIDSSFTRDVILDSELEQEALNRHLKWGEEEDFWKYEYNYRSSVASAIHRVARIKCGIPGADKKEEELTGEEKDIIGVLEHKRWNAYMRSEGYVYAEKRNNLAKTHYDLICFEDLTREEKDKDSCVGTD